MAIQQPGPIDRFSHDQADDNRGSDEQVLLLHRATENFA
jgi:hypothetical protein